TNDGEGVYLCPNVTTVAGVSPSCSDRVIFTAHEVDGLTAKTVGSASGVTVTLVNATDTGVGSPSDAGAYYKVVGLNGTGGGPNDDVVFSLNNGTTYVDTDTDIQITNVTTNGDPGFADDVIAAYRWTVDGANLMALNMPFNTEDGVTVTHQRDFSGNDNHGTRSGATYTALGQVGGAMSFDGNDYVDVANESAFDYANAQFSVSGWFKTSNSGVDQDIVSKALV